MKAVCYFQGTPSSYGLDQSDLTVAIEQFEDFIIDHPESEAVEDARKYLTQARTRLAHKHYQSGIVYVRIGDYKAARVYFQKVIDEYTDTEFAPPATYQLADGYYQLEDWDEAHERFENFRIVFSDHEWVAKAEERSCDALFRGGVEAFDEDDRALSKQRFERLKLVCGDSHEKAEDVDRYLQLIGDVPVVEAKPVDVGSAER